MLLAGGWIVARNFRPGVHGGPIATLRHDPIYARTLLIVVASDVVIIVIRISEYVLTAHSPVATGATVLLLIVLLGILRLRGRNAVTAPALPKKDESSPPSRSRPHHRKRAPRKRK